ncbi:MAG: DUF366 family protein [Brevinematales bacterium]|nr:DUF366 family protein [Brevinematales bacterium]
MKGIFIEREIKYDGSQLSSHFAYKNFKIAGDSIVCFIGPVDVKLSEMVDIEDVINNEPISSDKMLNFIIEVFGFEIKGLIALQRLFINIIRESIESINPSIRIERDGDDLYYKGKKLSISIATLSPISGLIHTAINIVNTGCPIEVSSLEEMGIDYKEAGKRIIDNFISEYEGIKFASVKVNWVS